MRYWPVDGVEVPPTAHGRRHPEAGASGTTPLGGLHGDARTGDIADVAADFSLAATLECLARTASGERLVEQATGNFRILVAQDRQLAPDSRSSSRQSRYIPTIIGSSATRTRATSNYQTLRENETDGSLLPVTTAATPGTGQSDERPGRFQALKTARSKSCRRESSSITKAGRAVSETARPCRIRPDPETTAIYPNGAGVAGYGFAVDPTTRWKCSDGTGGVRIIAGPSATNHLPERSEAWGWRERATFSWR
jgi:hypothetical protein